MDEATGYFPTLGTLSMQFSSATRERLDEEPGKTSSDTHNK